MKRYRPPSAAALNAACDELERVLAVALRRTTARHPSSWVLDAAALAVAPTVHDTPARPPRGRRVAHTHRTRAAA